MLYSLRRARISAVVVLLLSITYNAPQFAEREAYEETVGCGQGYAVRTRWRTRKTDVFGPVYYVFYRTISISIYLFIKKKQDTHHSTTCDSSTGHTTRHISALTAVHG